MLQPALPAGGRRPRGGAWPVFEPAPGASGLCWRPLRAGRLHANGPLPPAFLLAAPPPRTRPDPARRKSLNWGGPEGLQNPRLSPAAKATSSRELPSLALPPHLYPKPEADRESWSLPWSGKCNRP